MASSRPPDWQAWVVRGAGILLILAAVGWFIHRGMTARVPLYKQIEAQLNEAVRSAEAGDYEAAMPKFRDGVSLARRSRQAAEPKAQRAFAKIEAEGTFLLGAFQLRQLRAEVSEKAGLEGLDPEAAVIPADSLKEPEEHLRRSLDFRPSNARAWRLLGVIEMERGRNLEAISNLDRAVEEDDRLAVAYNDLGIAYTRLRQPDRAREYFQRAVDVDPQLANAHYNLGLYFAKADTPGREAESLDRAARHLQTFLDLSGKSLSNRQRGPVTEMLAKLRESRKSLAPATP